MNTKHTPGPWFIEPRSEKCLKGKVSIETDEYFICQVDESMRQEANARLIAAAPEVLEALISLEDEASFAGIEQPQERRRVGAALEKARAAIAKATGA